MVYMVVDFEHIRKEKPWCISYLPIRNQISNEKYDNFFNRFNLNSCIPIQTALAQCSSDFDLRVYEKKLAQRCHVSCHRISSGSLNLNYPRSRLMNVALVKDIKLINYELMINFVSREIS